MSEELKKYIEELEEELRDIEKERKGFYQKTRKGESLTREENKRNSKLTDRAKEINEQLDIISTVNSLEVMKGELARLGKNSVSESEKKDAIIPMLKSYFEKFNKQTIKKFSKKYGFSQEDLEKAEETKNILEQELEDLNTELEKAKKRKFNTTDIEIEINDKKKQLSSYEEFLKAYMDPKQLDEDLRNIMNDTTLTEVEIIEIKGEIVKLQERNKDLSTLLEFLKFRKQPTTDAENEIKNNEETIAIFEKQVEEYEKATPSRKKLTDDEIKLLEKNKTDLENDIEKLKAGLEYYKKMKFNDDDIKDLEEEIDQKQKEIVNIKETLNTNSNTVTKEEAETAKSIKESLKNEIEILNNRLNDDKLEEGEEKEIKKEIKNKEDKIEEYEKIISAYESHKKPYSMTAKEKILSKYNIILDNMISANYKELEDIMNKTNKKVKKNKTGKPDDDKDKTLKEKLGAFKTKTKEKFEELKAKTKEKLNLTDKKLSESTKTTLKVGTVIILAIAICVAFSQCSKNNKNKNNQAGNEPTTTQTDGLLDPTLDPTYKNPVYIEDIKRSYNLTEEEAIDMINRASKILESGFYGDVPLNQIVQVLDAVDDKDLNRVENAALDQSINAQLTGIYNNFEFGGTTDADLAKLDALNHFAREGSELDGFLETYYSLLHNILENQTKTAECKKAKEAMYEFLNVFANSYAGYIPEDTTLSASAVNAYRKAVMTDTFSWGIAYESYVKPMMSAFIEDDTVDKWVCLQINMKSNYEQWVKIHACEDTTLNLSK